MRRRPLFRVAACLMVGVVVTVGAAWACARWVPEPGGPERSRALPDAWPGPVPKGWPDRPVALAERFAAPDDPGAWVCARLGRTRLRVVATERGSSRAWIGHRFGLPLPAMQRVVLDWRAFGAFTFPYVPEGIAGGLDPATWRPSDQRGFLGSSDQYLPLLPVWPGFAIDVAAYAALVWLVLLAPGRLRRRLRRGRGGCAGCGYSSTGLVAGAPCPECGRARA